MASSDLKNKQKINQNADLQLLGMTYNLQDRVQEICWSSGIGSRQPEELYLV